MPSKRGRSTARVSVGGRPTKGGRQQVVVVVDDRNVVPHLPSSTSPAPRRKRKPTATNRQSWVGQLPITVSRFVWRHRWRLTPLTAWLVAFVGLATNVPATLAGLVALGTTAYVLAQANLELRGRKLMSKAERMLVTYWCIGAVAAGIVELVSGDWNGRRVLFTLTAATAWPAYLWLAGRTSTKTRAKMSKEAADRLKLWPRVSRYSEGTLKGSTIVGGTASEPTIGTLVFKVQLRADVHGKSAENEAVWRKVEALLALPADTVRMKCDRENATRIQVTMAASRHLEHHTVEWPGPELTDGGEIKLGDTPAGELVVIPRYDDKGVKHARISGNTGNGKSTTARVVCLARASATVTVAGELLQEETIWLIDGKRGTSVPEIRNVFDWYAVEDDEWPLILDSFYNVLIERQLRRGRANLSAWRPGKETDPIVTLYVAESSAVRRSLLARGLAKKYDRLALEVLQHGRALGVAMYQEAQDAIAENWLGGRQARELMSKGAAIMHRPGGNTGQQFAGDGAAERQSLLKLPDVEGFAAVVVNGKSRADVMRVRWCSEEAASEWAGPYTPRVLTGADAQAAGPNYPNRTRGRTDLNEPPAAEAEAVGADGPPFHSSGLARVHTPARVGTPSMPEVEWNGTPESTAESEPASTEEMSVGRDWVLKILTFNPRGLTATELIERGEGKRGRGKSSIYKHLADLRAAELVGQDGDTYFAVRKG